MSEAPLAGRLHGGVLGQILANCWQHYFLRLHRRGPILPFGKVHLKLLSS